MAQPSPIPVEDGSELTRQTWRVLGADAQGLGLPDLRIQPLDEFLAAAGQQQRISHQDRQTILDQATLIFDHFYPHLPFKSDIFRCAHPSQVIRENIQPRIDVLSNAEFHSRVLDAFSSVRDAHTLYGLPTPYRDAVAFLPFQIRAYLDRKVGWRFIVSAVMRSQAQGGFGHPYFGPGAEILGWGELSPLAHIERTETHLPGGNYFASFARGAVHSTVRPLRFVPAPFSDDRPAATIHYRAPGSTLPRAIRLPWAAAVTSGSAVGFPSSAFSESPATRISTVWNRYLHHREAPAGDPPANATRDPAQVSTIPEMFDFQYTGGARKIGSIDTADLMDARKPDARFGYVAIKAFSDGASAPGFTDRIVDEFQRILTIMDQNAPDGLVIDIRDNPGGDVQAAERMLQMLTAQPIQPAPFHLANTAAILGVLRTLRDAAQKNQAGVQLAETLAELEPWMNDAEQQPLPEGPPLTSGQPLTDPDSANQIGQIYQGRGVALLINSLTYSAADIFSGGFQDHAIGPVLGISMLTGGGGANVWSHEDLIGKIGPRPGIPLANLPGDVSMSLAIRRSARVGANAGQPIEDEGVKVDVFYHAPSIEDVIAGNPGLVRRACEELTQKPVYRVDAGTPLVLPDGGLEVEVRTTKIDAVKFLVNGKLALTATPDGSGQQIFKIPALAGASIPSVLRVEGYAGDPIQLVRARTIRLQQPVALDDFDPATQSVTGVADDGNI